MTPWRWSLPWESQECLDGSDWRPDLVPFVARRLVGLGESPEIVAHGASPVHPPFC